MAIASPLNTYFFFFFSGRTSPDITEAFQLLPRRYLYLSTNFAHHHNITSRYYHQEIIQFKCAKNTIAQQWRDVGSNSLPAACEPETLTTTLFASLYYEPIKKQKETHLVRSVRLIYSKFTCQIMLFRSLEAVRNRNTMTFFLGRLRAAWWRALGPMWWWRPLP